MWTTPAHVLAVGVKEQHPPALDRRECPPRLSRGARMPLSPVLEVPLRTRGVVLVVSSDGLGHWPDLAERWVEDRPKRPVAAVLVLGVAERHEPVGAVADHARHQTPYAILLAVALHADQRTVGVTCDVADRDQPRDRDLLSGSIMSARSGA